MRIEIQFSLLLVQSNVPPAFDWPGYVALVLSGWRRERSCVLRINVGNTKMTKTHS